MPTLCDKFLATMIAVPPLPGSPGYNGSNKAIIAQALSDLRHYVDAGVDAIVLENSHDVPYIRPPLPAAAIKVMREIALEARSRFSGPIGIQMLEAANVTALEIAAAARLDFVRVEGFVFAHVGGGNYRRLRRKAPAPPPTTRLRRHQDFRGCEEEALLARAHGRSGHC